MKTQGKNHRMLLWCLRAISYEIVTNRQVVDHCPANQRIGRPWELIIKIPETRRKKAKRSALRIQKSGRTYHVHWWK